MPLRGKSALVFGATGFIGSHLVASLTEGGAIVTIVQRRPKAVASNKIDALICDEPFSYDALRGLLAGRRYDLLFNLAAYGVDPRQRDGALLQQVNVDLPPDIVRLSKGLGVQAVVMAGSGSEYDFAGINQPVSENHRLKVDDPYGSSKAEGWHRAARAAANLGIALAWARIFNCYGPGEAPHRLLPSLVGRLRANQTVDLSEGHQLRDFLYVKDATAGLVSLAGAQAGRSVPAAFNLCSGRAVTVRDFCKAVAKAVGKPEEKLQFGALPLRPGEMPYFCGDPTALQLLTGWKPAFDLQGGIEASLSELVE